MPTDGLNISWNGLYTSDGTLKTFLDSKQVGGDWESTQTTAPTGAAVDSVTDTTVSLSWTPILYQADSGTYRVYYSTISGSGYTLAGATADKYAGSYTVTGLSPATTYYFEVVSGEITEAKLLSAFVRASTPVGPCGPGSGPSCCPPRPKR